MTSSSEELNEQLEKMFSKFSRQRFDTYKKTQDKQSSIPEVSTMLPYRIFFLCKMPMKDKSKLFCFIKLTHTLQAYQYLYLSKEKVISLN